MNNRIKELARKAYVEDSKSLNPIWEESKLDHLMMDELDSVFELFAKHIVNECADVIQKEVSMKYKDGGETEEFMGGHYAGSLLARVKIKQHFGVSDE